MKKIHYNSPVILTLFFLSLGALGLDWMTGGWTTRNLFSVYAASMLNPLFYIRLFGHILGHGSFAHFAGNMVLLLVVGPPLEEKYGSKRLLTGVLLTALTSGVLQCVFFRTALLGASGIVFMLIMLSSLSGMKSGSIPLTLILVAVLYLGQEVLPPCSFRTMSRILCTLSAGRAVRDSACCSHPANPEENACP